MVKVCDLASRTVTQIPAAELAPGMVRVQIRGMEGEFWVDGAQLRVGEYRHPPFDEQARDLFRRLQTTFADVYPLTMAEWEDNFRRDSDPDQEVGLWLHAARVYRAFIGDRALPLGCKLDAFQVLLSCMNNPRDSVLMVVDLREMARQEAEELVNSYFAD